MIDNEKEVHELIEALNQHLPMRAYATPPLVKAVRAQGTDIEVNDAVKIDSVLYLGDEGGVACSIGLESGKTVVVASITHLRIASDHPLATRIQAYQLRRSQRLEGPVGRRSSKSRAGRATKLKRQKVRVAPNEGPKENDLMPHFRAACGLWESGEYKLAADSFRKLFNLDLRDPYFSRYWLASSMFQLGSYDELEKLLQRQDDHSGVWRFAQALVAFRLHGDTEHAQRLLAEADHLEPGFEHYLLRDKVVDAGCAMRFDAGDAERAFGCARLFLPAWRWVPDAVAWARRVLKVPPTGAGPDNVPRRFPRDELRALPLRRENWQVGLTPRSDEPNGEHAPMWLLGVANVGGQEIRAVTVIDQPPTETVVWNQMIQSFLSPIEGDPARPATLVVCRREFCDAWEPLLSEIGVRCRYENDPQPVVGPGAVL